jgi:Protein tyrosine and serine/threonine kinase
MSPEVALNEPYGLATDLYSFSVLFWEVLSLEKAYGRLSVDEHKERVIRGSERLPLKWTKGLNQILADCWTRDQRARPEAADVKLMLRREIQDLVARDFPTVVARNNNNNDA